MEKKVLVTGASGLIGREICKQLKNHFYVVAIDNGFRGTDIPECDIFENIDIESYVNKSRNDFDYIFHMGNINGTKYFYDIPNDLIENNILTDFSIFNFVKKNSACKLIYASSSEVVAGTITYPTNEQTDITINDIHNPRWSYRLGKIVGENYLTNSKLNYLIVRFFNIYSEHSKNGHFIKDITDKIKKNEYILIGANETRSFCHVYDAVDALIAIKDVSKNVVNIGSDEEITIIDAANIIAKNLGVTNISWILKDSLPGSVLRRVPDITLLRKYYPKFRPEKFESAYGRIANKGNA